MNKNQIIMVGKCSECHSPFAVFESFSSWVQTRAIKVIPVGYYFAVCVVEKKIADIYPNLFVQGYRPHSSSKWNNIASDKRRYAAFIRKAEKVAPDDVVFYSCQLYKVLSEREVELVLKDEESHDEDKMKNFSERLCQELQITPLSGLRRAKFRCSESTGYFLAGRVYDVWSLLAGEETKLEGMKKVVLMIDYETGIPGKTSYDEANFEML